MDKKYYSEKHRRYNNKKNNNIKKSAFLMRLNISLGIAIVAIGIYKLDNELSRNMTITYKELVGGNISFEDIKKDIDIISSIKNTTSFAYGKDGSIKLDDSVVEYINNMEDSYILNNTPAQSP